MERKKKPRILACDPSFTGWGWAVMQGGIIKASGVIVTKALAKKRKIREGDDLTRRVREMINELSRIIDRYGVTYIVSEQPHGSQNAKGAIMIGVVVGILESWSHLRNIPVEWYLEADSKKNLLGRNSATKQEVIDAVDGLFTVTWTGVQFRDEAVADALAIYNCAEINSPTIKFMNQ